MLMVLENLTARVHVDNSLFFSCSSYLIIRKKYQGISFCIRGHQACIMSQSRGSHNLLLMLQVKSSCTEETSAKQEALKGAVSDGGLTKLEEKADRCMQEQKQQATTQMHERFRNEKLGSSRVREREGDEGKEKEKEKEKDMIKEKEKKSIKNVSNFQNCETG